MEVKYGIFNQNNAIMPTSQEGKKPKKSNPVSIYTHPTDTSFPDDIKDRAYNFAKTHLYDNQAIFMSNKNWTNDTSIESQLNELPKENNGSYDKEKIKQATKTAIQNITNMNNLATEKINYEKKKKNINGFDLNLLLAPPEITYLFEKSGLIKENRIDFMGKPRKILKNLLDSDKKSFLNKNLSVINEDALPLNCFDIKKNIDSQQEKLKELEKMPLNSKEDIIAFLQTYKNITGTTFSYNGIMNSGLMIDDKDLSGKGKIKEYTKLYGVPQNYIEANKNRIATDIAYEVGLKYALPKGLSHVPTGIAWAPFMPVCIETGEVMSKGDKVFNTDNFTKAETTRIALDGAVKGFMVVAPVMPGGDKIVSSLNGPKTSPIPFIGQTGWNIFRNWGIRPARLASVSAAQKTIVNAVSKNSKAPTN